jgi:hypothetical protein
VNESARPRLNASTAPTTRSRTASARHFAGNWTLVDRILKPGARVGAVGSSSPPKQPVAPRSTRTQSLTDVRIRQERTAIAGRRLARRRPSASVPDPNSRFLQVGRSDEHDASRKSYVEVERATKAMDVVETDTIGVTTHCPDQDDVTGESASLVLPGRDIHSSYSPAVERQGMEWTNSSARIPGRAVDDLRIASKRSRRGHDDEVLVIRLARTHHPASPRPRATPDSPRADDVELTLPHGSGCGQSFRHSRWTRHRVTNLVGCGSALFPEFG